MIISYKHNLYIFFIFLIAFAIWVFYGYVIRSSNFIKGMTVSCQTWGYEWATPQMKETMVELKRIQKVVDQRTALEIDALSVKAGEVVALVGPVGSGRRELR